MNFILSSLLLTSSVSAAAVTETQIATQVVYQQVNVRADANGVPYATETVSGGGPGGAPTSAAAVPDSPTSTSYSSASKHSHANVPNYNYISQTSPSGLPVTTSPTEWASSTPAPAPPAPSTSTSPSYEPAPTTPSAPTTPASSSTTSSTPASTSSSSGGGEEFNGQVTFYEVGLGACGWTNSDDELVAALNWEQWDQFGSESNGNPACNKKATLNYEGKSVTVKIVDKCMGCKYGDLDLSPSAFKQLAPESVGRMEMSWSFV